MIVNTVNIKSVRGPPRRHPSTFPCPDILIRKHGKMLMCQTCGGQRSAVH